MKPTTGEWLIIFLHMSQVSDHVLNAAAVQLHVQPGIILNSV